MFENRPIHITDDEFDKEVLQSKGLVAVDFWAPWCGPCHTMAPALEEFAAANAGKVKVFKLDAEDNPKTSERYAIKSIPTIIFFRDGKPVETVVGAASQSVLKKKLADLLNG
ncbi:MAG: thioredoxin [Thermodesulfobacteriota bacterium]